MKLNLDIFSSEQEKEIIDKKKQLIIQEIKRNSKTSEIIEQYSILDQEIEKNLDLFIQVLEKNENFEVSIVRTETGTLKKVFILSEKRKKEKYKQNFWLTEIFSFDVDLDLKTLLKQNQQKDTKINSRFLKVIEKYKNLEHGFYFYGDMGVGKTKFLQATSVHFAKKNNSIIFLNIPIFQTYLNNKITSKTLNLNEILEKLKKVDKLFLDDFGLEKKSMWFRDSVLYEILNYRLENSKITFFSSNYSLLELKKIYLDSFVDNNKKEDEEFKVTRFIERIKGLTEEYKIFGKNLRNK
ncbi:DnaA ATPase domain-containing protein [Mycoplasma sp. 480]|uniref:DnaA ATPase domain-containing protein n=1 Tax=Mycoplasma sp. 480 TaxID=3440155 RepID=UPI003F51526A